MKNIDFKSLVIGALSSIIVFLIMGQYQNGFLRVQRLEVVDENGKAVIKLGSVDNNGSIETYNASGNLIIGITSSVDGEGAINTYNANEKQINNAIDFFKERKITNRAVQDFLNSN